MRVYQLTCCIPPFSELRYFGILYEYLSEPMACDTFVKYFKDFNIKKNITNTTINAEYLNKLNVGKNMLEPGWDINVSIISQKIRLYSYDNNNDLFPTEFNINELQQFKDKLTEEYNNIVNATTHELTISLDELTSDEYLNALAVGDNYITYKFKYSDGSTSLFNCNFNIIVSEHVI